MKFRPSHYARAFLESLADGVPYESAKSRLLAVLAKNGDSHRTNQVVYEIEKLEVAKHGGRMVNVEFARTPKSSDETKILSTFTKADRVATRITPELIAGTRITLDDERELDFSLAGRMRVLFQN